jgi:hypothetical protein
MQVAQAHGVSHRACASTQETHCGLLRQKGLRNDLLQPEKQNNICVDKRIISPYTTYMFKEVVPMERVYTAAQVAAALAVHPATVRRLQQRGELQALPILGRLRFTESAVRAFMARERECLDAPRRPR